MLYSCVIGVVMRSQSALRRVSIALLVTALACVCAGCNSARAAQQESSPPTVQHAQNSHSSDSFTPAETIAASSLAVIGSATNIGKADALEPRYQVAVDRVVFNVVPRRVSSSVTAFGSNLLRLRDNEKVLLALSPSIEDPSSVQFTTRVSAVGFLRASDIDFRSVDGRLVRFPVARDSSVGCFVAANPAGGCRAALLARFGIRSPRQQRVYDELLRKSPAGGVIWIHAYRRTQAAFPDRLCTRSVTTNCASAQAFFKSARLDLKT